MNSKQINTIATLIALVGFFFMAMAFRFCKPKWEYQASLQSKHYECESNASREMTLETLEKAEVLFEGYRRFFGPKLNLGEPDKRLKLRLYKDRPEFKKYSIAPPYAEAYYIYPYTHQYVEPGNSDGFHWMIHEATHQLNREYAHFRLRQWMEEGLASYFSTSQIYKGVLQPGNLNPRTYPVWHMVHMPTTGDLEKDLHSGRVTPLPCVLSRNCGPSVSDRFNSYYIHWLVTVHFLLHYKQGRYKEKFLQLIQEGGSVEGFEKIIGPTKKVQMDWYRHLNFLLNQFKNK